MQNQTLKPGDHVIDIHGHEGIVVVVQPGNDVEDHGTVAVWQMNRTEYGIDNCEHYCEFGWEKSLRIIKN